MKKYDFVRFGFLMFGFVMFSFGIVLMIQSSLGPSPWDVFHIGLSNHTPLSIGQIGQLVGLILIFISWALGVKPGIGTVCNMYFIGFFIDFYLGRGLVPAPVALVERFAYLIIGTVIIGLGTTLFIYANFGTGPRDSLMLGLQRKFGLRIGLTRGLLELTVVIVGTLLRGGPGIGTLFFTIAIGPLVELFMPLMDKFTHLPTVTKVFHQQL